MAAGRSSFFSTAEPVLLRAEPDFLGNPRNRLQFLFYSRAASFYYQRHTASWGAPKCAGIIKIRQAVSWKLENKANQCLRSSEIVRVSGEKLEVRFFYIKVVFRLRLLQ